jgi:predicted AlkP superfamily pyrophosphatase or phosphodiesterase
MSARAWLVMLLLAPACQQVPRRVSSSSKISAQRLPEPFCAGVPAPPTAAPSARHAIADHVIILSEDGMRPDALELAKAPVHQALMREGAFTMHARTIRRASTLPSHAAMLSGFDVEEHGLSWNSWQPSRGFIKVPTVFSVAHDAGQESVAFVGKRKLEHIAQPGSVTLFSNPGYFCRKVVGPAAAHFRENRPQVEFVHFSDPDESGHSVGWMSEEQLAAIGHTDECLAKLVEAIKATAPDRTLLIISADHGGRGRGHNGAREEDRLIPWIAWGAGVRPGHRIDAPVSTVDTAATALWALGYAPSAGGVGHPVLEAFVDPAPAPKN